MRWQAFVLAMLIAQPVWAGGSRDFVPADNDQMTPNYTDFTDAIGLAVWIKLDADPAALRCISHKGQTNSIPRYFEWRLDARGEDISELLWYSSGNHVYDDDDNSLDAYYNDTWFHLATTIDWGDGDSDKIWYDGGSVNTNGTSTAVPDGTQSNERIAARAGGDQDWDGWMAYHHIFSRVITDAEVNEIMWKPEMAYGSTSALVGLWPIWGEDSPEIDISGNGFDATLVDTPAEDTSGPPVMLGSGGV